MKIPEKYLCDVCGKEISKSETERKIYCITACEWTEGRASEKHAETTMADLCDSCFIRGINFVADFRGSNLRFADKERDEDDDRT